MRDAWGLNFRLIQIKHMQKEKGGIDVENIELATFFQEEEMICRYNTIKLNLQICHTHHNSMCQ